jgi:hypothetical protein
MKPVSYRKMGEAYATEHHIVKTKDVKTFLVIRERGKLAVSDAAFPENPAVGNTAGRMCMGRYYPSTQAGRLAPS